MTQRLSILWSLSTRVPCVLPSTEVLLTDYFYPCLSLPRNLTYFRNHCWISQPKARTNRGLPCIRWQGRRRS